MSRWLLGDRLHRIETELRLLRGSFDALRDAVAQDRRVEHARLYAFRRQTMGQLDDVLAEVQASRAGVDSAVALIDSLADRFEAAAGDPAKVQAIVDEVRAQRAELADAVATPGTDEPSEGTDAGSGELPGGDTPPTPNEP